MTSTPSRVCEALDRMIESVLADLKEQDPGNHATIGSLQGELKGLQAARRLASMQSEIEPKNAAAQVSGMATPGTVAEADRSELTAVGTASHPATGPSAFSATSAAAMPASAASSDKPVAVIVRYELYETQGQKRVAIRYADDVEEDRPSTELEEHLLSARSAGVACKYTKGRCLRERCNAVLCCEAEECARSAERASPDVEKMLDNAACAAQVLALMRTDDGRETALREAVRLNVVEPLLRFAHYATRLTADEHQLISTAALHLATWATSSNKEPYGNTLDVARRLEAFLSGTERTGNG